MHFKRASVLSEKQRTLSITWTWVTNSINNDDNRNDKWHEINKYTIIY